MRVNAALCPMVGADGTVEKVVEIATFPPKDQGLSASVLGKTTAFETASAPMMTVDRDFIVTEINQATVDLMMRSADAFAEVWPGFDPNEIIGTCIDRFHANPEHQRKMLSDPANLPYKTDITIGDFKFALKVGAILDENGAYVGNVLEWGDVTTERMNAGVLGALDSSQAMIEFTADGQIITANANFCAATGYDLAEIEGEHHRMMLHESDAASDDYKSFWKELASGEAKDGEFKRRGKDGSEIWLKAIYNPIVDNNGNVFKVVKIASDITAQIEIRKTAETLSLVANETDNSVIISDAQGRIEYVNPGFVKLTGYTLEEVAGKQPGDILYGPLTDDETKRQISENLAAKKPFLAEILNYSKSGEAYWVSTVVNPVFDAQGEVERFVSIQANVTEVKQAQIDHTCKLDAISRDMAMIEFKPDGTIISANENFCAATGYALNEIEGKHHRMFCEAEYSKSADYAQLWERLAGGQTESGKFKRFDRHGNEVWLRASYSPIVDAANQVTKVVKYATDITPEIELEKEVTRISTAFVEKVSQISEQAGKVAGGAQTLGVTTEEISASIEELSASIDSIAQNGRMSDEIAQRTKAEADVGARAIDRSIESMGLINSSSEKINEIVKVISEIASQTNMLAFNAAIEAARAGQHGLGFSVVADEVRKLAERSSQATKEISNLINETVKRVSQGSEVSREAGEAFKKILDGITETTESISQISIAATEQQTAARDVAEAVQSIVEASEESAIASDSIASSTNELTAGAAELQAEITKLGV